MTKVHAEDLTVAIVCRDSASHIDRALRALGKQAGDLFRLHLRVVDHGSVDATRDLLRGFDPGPGGSVRIWNDPQNHLAKSRNRLLDECSTHFILFLDSDAVVRPGWLRRAYEHLRADPNCAGVGGPPFLTGRERQQGIWSQVLRDVSRSWMLHMGSIQGRSHCPAPRAVDHLPCSAALFRTNVLRDVRFDEAYATAGEDLDLGWRLRARGSTLKVYPDLGFFHMAAPNKPVQWFWRVFKLGFGRSRVARGRPRSFVRSIHLIPLAYPFVLALTTVGSVFWPLLAAVPGGYLIFSAIEVFRHGRGDQLIRSLCCLVGTHVGYSAGQWAGLLARSGSR